MGVLESLATRTGRTERTGRGRLAGPVGFLLGIKRFFIELDDGKIYRKPWLLPWNIQESPIFHGKNHGFRWRFSLKPTQWFFLLTLDFSLETPLWFLLTLGWLSHISGTKWRCYGILMRFTVGFMGLNGISIGFDLMELLGQRLSMEYEWTIGGIYHVEIMNYCLQLGKSCTNGKLNESWIGWVDNGKTMENHHLENR